MDDPPNHSTPASVVQNGAAFPGHEDDDARVRDAIDGIYLVQLGTITAVMTGYYAFIGSMHFFVLPPAARLPMMAAAFAAAALSLLTCWLVRSGRVAAAQSHMALLPAALASTANVFLHAWLTADQLQLSNGAMLMLAFAIITLSPRIYGFLSATSLLVSVLALVLIPGPHMLHMAFMLVAASALSLLCFFQRYRTLCNGERLAVSNRQKAEKLADMNIVMEAQMQEARQAAEEARKANEAKDIFLANTSHELRTPLTGVLGMMTLLDQTKLDGEQRQLLTAAQLSANTLLTVINDILDMARLDARRFNLTIQAFSPGDLVATVCDLLRSRAEEKGLSLKRDVPPGASVRLMGDPVRIGQILFNFLTNAIKFTDAGMVTVRLELQEDGADMRLSLMVEDTGPGFDMAVAQRLFERFHQLDGSARKPQGGAGLGLAICRELADLMGAKITVSSVPGAGSGFGLSLRLARAGVEAPTAAAVALDDAAAQILARPLNILVAEDNMVNQLLIQKLLARFDWQLTLVDNGAKALARLEAGEQFDLVLMDVRMPVMDGITATRAIRALATEAAHVPIIALTANTGQADHEAYKKAGMDAMVAKPVQIDDLKTAIALLLQQAT